jgi:hypothetical protein
MNKVKFTIEENILYHNFEPLFECEIKKGRLSDTITMISDTWHAEDMSRALNAAEGYLEAMNESGELPT